MPTLQLTLDDLRRILRAAAGEAEGANLDSDIDDTRFSDLGYDSLALLETTGRIERELGVRLDDALVVDARTPRELLGAVNAQLLAAA